MGRAIPHTDFRAETDDVRYETETHLVDAAEVYANTVSNLLADEFDDEEAVEADAEANDYARDEVDAEKAASHYREQLRLAIHSVHRRADETDYDHDGYATTYPMVILRDE